jgi:hypothetical protein
LLAQLQQRPLQQGLADPLPLAARIDDGPVQNADARFPDLRCSDRQRADQDAGRVQRHPSLRGDGRGHQQAHGQGKGSPAQLADLA